MRDLHSYCRLTSAILKLWAGLLSVSYPHPLLLMSFGYTLASQHPYDQILHLASTVFLVPHHCFLTDVIYSIHTRICYLCFPAVTQSLTTQHTLLSVLIISAKTICNIKNLNDEIQHLWEMLRQNSYNTINLTELRITYVGYHHKRRAQLVWPQSHSNR